MNSDMLATARLQLREFTEADFPALLALVSHPEVMRFSDGIESEAAAHVRLAGYLRAYRERGFGKWAVQERSSGRVIGYCGFGWEEFDGVSRPELGFRLLPDCWGRGFATEAAAACDRHASAALGFNDYLGFAHPDNTASRRVLEKLGLVLLGERSFHGGPVVVYRKDACRNSHP